MIGRTEFKRLLSNAIEVDLQEEIVEIVFNCWVDSTDEEDSALPDTVGKSIANYLSTYTLRSDIVPSNTALYILTAAPALIDAWVEILALQTKTYIPEKKKKSIIKEAIQHSESLAASMAAYKLCNLEQSKEV